MKGRGGPRRYLAACLSLFFLGAAALLADYKASYEKGIRAIDNKDWGGAIEALRAAIAEKSVEGERVLIYGMRYKPYLPHYYLGLAYFNTGNCQAAMKAWGESERQGAVREMAEYKTIQSLREQCRGQGIRESEPTPAPSPDLKQAEKQAKEREGTEKQAALEKQAKEKEAREKQVALERQAKEKEAREKQAALEKQAKEKEAREKQAALEKQAKEKEAKEKQAALDRRAKEEAAAQMSRATLADINQKVREARPLLAEASRRRPLSPKASKLRKDLEAVVAQAQRARTATPLADLEKIRDRLGVSAASLKTALSEAPAAATAAEGKPPAALVEAAAAFFKGDYAVAARALETAEFPDPRANAQARLLRGAARYSVFIVGGEKDERLRQQAIEDVRECRRLNPKLDVSTRAFSPRFVEFFKKNGGPTRG